MAPFLTPRLENATEKMPRKRRFRDMKVGRFVRAANDVTIGGFWRGHAKGELKTRKNHEILRVLSPCWEKRYIGGMFLCEGCHLRCFRVGVTEYAH